MSQPLDFDSGRTSPRLHSTLAVTTMGVYLLVVGGAVTTTTAAATACGSWPTCRGGWLVPFENPAVIIAWSHRIATLVVGLVVLATVVAAWRDEGGPRVRWSVTGAGMLYLVQVGVGAVAATTQPSLALSVLHLILAMGIFSALLVALAWTLEATTGRNTSASTQSSSDIDDEMPSATMPDGPSVENQPGGPTDTHRGGLLAVPKAYLTLTKPKLMWLLCLVALAAMAMAAGPTLPLSTVATTLLGGVLAIGASGTFNNVIERDRDRKMTRTADRPLPQNQIPSRHAVVFGLLLAGSSLAVFVAFVNLLTAALAALAIAFYSAVYTVVLKPHTSKNIVLGGAVGGFPALIGWAAVTDAVGLPALALGGIIFLWTPAHFYNLALAYSDDYASADLPMLPVVSGATVTRKHILLYLGATLLAASALAVTTSLDWMYAGVAGGMGAVFLWAVVHLHHERTDAAALKTFHASNAYLGSLLVAILVDTVFL